MSEGDNLDGGMFEYSLCAGTFLGLGNKKILCKSSEIYIRLSYSVLTKLIRPKIKIAALFE